MGNGKKNTRQYKLISADGHLNEPADVWTSRVAKKYRDLVPRVESLEQGDGWVFPGYDQVFPSPGAPAPGATPTRWTPGAAMPTSIPAPTTPRPASPK